MKDLSEIRDILYKRKTDLFEKYQIKSMAIFGSYGRNVPTNNSDLDILVDIKPSVGIQFIDLADELEEITGIKVDLVSRGGIKQKYFNKIERDLVYV